jgi:hypothetical protein
MTDGIRCSLIIIKRLVMKTVEEIILSILVLSISLSLMYYALLRIAAALVNW